MAVIWIPAFAMALFAGIEMLLDPEGTWEYVFCGASVVVGAVLFVIGCHRLFRTAGKMPKSSDYVGEYFAFTLAGMLLMFLMPIGLLIP